jgi:hypothetical protein
MTDKTLHYSPIDVTVCGGGASVERSITGDKTSNDDTPFEAGQSRQAANCFASWLPWTLFGANIAFHSVLVIGVRCLDPFLLFRDGYFAVACYVPVILTTAIAACAASLASCSQRALFVVWLFAIAFAAVHWWFILAAASIV